MLKWSKRLLTGLIAVLALFSGLASFGYWWLRGHSPPYGNTVAASGLKAPVEVVLDANAVPHIFANSMADAYFALGYVHARDRLWQMETQRRVGQGRMAEILGARALNLDRYMRTMGVYQAAQDSFGVLSPEVRRALGTYAQGVNFYLTHRTEPLPIEFQLTFHQPEPWAPADSLIWLKLMAFVLSGNHRHELLRAQLLQVLTPQQLRDLFPGSRADDPVTLPDAQGLASSTIPPSIQERTHAGQNPSSFWPLGSLPISQLKASNIWAISGAHTASGKPILVNDPHLSLDAPIVWYLARIVTPELTLAGATAPGMPFHLLGYNRDLAWGMTTTGSDVQDLFYETVSPDRPNQYLAPDGWRQFESRTENIQVRLGDEILHTVRTTRHGPVLSDIDPAAEALAEPNRVLALAFTALGPRDPTIEGIYRLNRARNWDEILAATRFIRGPQQNLFFADTAGNIGFVAPAQVPIRNSGEGYLPVVGADDRHGWLGFIDFEALPQTLNPSRGWLVNANNAIVGPDYPFFLTHDWEAPYRARRIEQLIQDRIDGQEKPYTMADAEADLMDTISLAAQELLPLMSAIETADPKATQALALLRRWDGAMDRDRPEPLIFNTWLSAMNRALYRDELGDWHGVFGGLNPRLVARTLATATYWCDDVATPNVAETCAEMLGRSLATAIAALAARYGSDPTAWRWGEAHRASFAHPLLGKIPLLAQLSDIGIETDGGNYTVNRGASHIGPMDALPEAVVFPHRHGASLRAIYDLADLDQSRFMIATGQSGNPLSPHYDQFVESWRQGHFITLSGNREELRESSLGVLHLRPE